MYLEDNEGVKWDILMHWDWDFFLVGLERHNFFFGGGGLW